jgi:hypothetical protein
LLLSGVTALGVFESFLNRLNSGIITLLHVLHNFCLKIILAVYVKGKLNKINYKMKNKLGFVLAFVCLAVLLVNMSVVLATTETKTFTLPIEVKEMIVYVNGEEFYHGICGPFSSSNGTSNGTVTCTINQATKMPSIVRGENVDVKVVIVGADNAEKALLADNVNMRVWYRQSGTTTEDVSDIFDLYRNNQYVRTMYLPMPSTMDAFKIYTMHVEIEGDDLSGLISADIPFDVQRVSNALDIKSLDIKSSCEVACNSITVDAVIKNVGAHDLEDIYVKATIKELGISGTEFIDVLVPYRTHDDSTTEEVSVVIQLPSNVKSGTYTLEVTAYNDDAETTVTQQFTISGASTPTGTVDVTPQTTRQDIAQGQSGAYTLIVTNNGASTQTFSVEATGLEGWATSQITPSAFSLAPGDSQLVTVYVTAKDDAITAEHLFSVKVKYGNDAKSFNFVSNITSDKAALDLKSILMIVGIVLAVAIIILLIVLLAQKTRTSEKPEESYY